MTKFLLAFVLGAIAWQILTSIVGIVTGTAEIAARVGMGVVYLIIDVFHYILLLLAKICLQQVRFYDKATGISTTRYVPCWRVKWFKTIDESDGKRYVEVLGKFNNKVLPLPNQIYTGQNLMDCWVAWTKYGQEYFYFAYWAKKDSPLGKKIIE